MKDKTIIYESGYLTVATGADQSWELPVGLGCHFYLQFGNVTGLTCSITVSYDGGTQYVNIVSVTSAGTSVAAGGTITTADGLKVYFDAEGATHVKVTYVGGTDGPVRLVGTDGADGLVAARLLQFIASGIIAAESASTPYFLIVDGTDELLISASARRLTYADVFHINDAPIYAKFYDKATAASESDTPIYVVGGPAAATAANGGGSNKSIPPGGISLTNGLSVRVVKGIANADDTASDAAEAIVNAGYKTS